MVPYEQQKLLRMSAADASLEIFYWAGRRGEVDFVVKKGAGVAGLVQVCWNIDPADTRERELAGLREAMALLRVKKGLIITGEEPGEKPPAGIRYIPLWRWLLAPGI